MRCPVLLSILVAIWLVLVPDGARADKCLSGAGAEQDRIEIFAARAEVASLCDCQGADSPKAYLSCARSVLGDAASAGLLRRSCRSKVVQMEKESTCGLPLDDPRVVCVSGSSGARRTVSCDIEAASDCVSSEAAERTVCSAPAWPYTHCIDAADSNGDLVISAPLDEGRCALSQRVFLTPSAAQPGETPGSPGVVVSDPRLLTQFGSADFDLNQGIYTRWRFNGVEQQPDAILILVAGFGGGANNFKPLAENLLSRVLRDHGLVLEVWGFHRRSNQLEDRAGVAIATSLADPLVALDWYYGAELGLSLDPALADGPNRRAFFYNESNDVPFLANWTTQVFSQDIDAVVEVARSVARNGNVFLGGHSAGTGFAARYAATDFDLTGVATPDPGYAKLRGLVLLEGGGGSTATTPLSDDSLDRIIAKFEGGNFGAVRDQEPRCVDGTTPCSIETEATDCAAQTPPVCTLPTSAYLSFIPGAGPGLLAASEVIALQGLDDPDTGQAIIQVDQGAPGNSAAAVVPSLALLNILPAATAQGAVGSFLDDESLGAQFSPAIATSLGALGPIVNDLQSWQDITEGPLPPQVLPDNGPPPTALPGSRWGQEKEVVRMDRLFAAFLAADSNAADWYFSASGLSVTNAPGRCEAFVCTVGAVGGGCFNDGNCAQSISLDSSDLSLDPPAGRGRRDIVNLTQAGAIDIPVICFGGSNGLTPVPARYVPFAQSIAVCGSPSCEGSTPRLIDASIPNPAFPTFGGVDGGFEVHISEGLAHADVTFGEDNADTAQLYGPLSDFLARNIQ